MLQGCHCTDLQFVAAATRALAKQMSRSNEVCQSELLSHVWHFLDLAARFAECPLHRRCVCYFCYTTETDWNVKRAKRTTGVALRCSKTLSLSKAKPWAGLGDMMQECALREFLVHVHQSKTKPDKCLHQTPFICFLLLALLSIQIIANWYC